MPNTTLIKVDIGLLDGWYMATSPSLKGLHVAHPDPAVVFKEIPEVIKAIYKARDGVEVSVEVTVLEGTKEAFPLHYTARMAA